MVAVLDVAHTRRERKRTKVGSKGKGREWRGKRLVDDEEEENEEEKVQEVVAGDVSDAGGGEQTDAQSKRRDDADGGGDPKGVTGVGIRRPVVRELLIRKRRTDPVDKKLSAGVEEPEISISPPPAQDLVK